MKNLSTAIKTPSSGKLIRVQIIGGYILDDPTKPRVNIAVERPTKYILENCTFYFLKLFREKWGDNPEKKIYELKWATEVQPVFFIVKY